MENDKELLRGKEEELINKRKDIIKRHTVLVNNQDCVTKGIVDLEHEEFKLTVAIIEIQEKIKNLKNN